MGRKIALVEDEPSLQVNYSGALERHGYDVSVYSNRKDAIAAFEVSLPELAIIDVGLGNEAEGGFELCRQLRGCLLYTSPSPRDATLSRMPSSA